MINDIKEAMEREGIDIFGTLPTAVQFYRKSSAALHML